MAEQVLTRDAISSRAQVSSCPSCTWARTDLRSCASLPSRPAKQSFKTNAITKCNLVTRKHEGSETRVWVTHASRVWATVSRRRELSSTFAQAKTVSARRQNQVAAADRYQRAVRADSYCRLKRRNIQNPIARKRTFGNQTRSSGWSLSFARRVSATMMKRK